MLSYSTLPHTHSGAPVCEFLSSKKIKFEKGERNRELTGTAIEISLHNSLLSNHCHCPENKIVTCNLFGVCQYFMHMIENKEVEINRYQVSQN